MLEVHGMLVYPPLHPHIQHFVRVKLLVATDRPSTPCTRPLKVRPIELQNDNS